eukprot:3435444-Rhodomonas_salina.4
MESAEKKKWTDMAQFGWDKGLPPFTLAAHLLTPIMPLFAVAVPSFMEAFTAAMLTSMASCGRPVST